MVILFSELKSQTVFHKVFKIFLKKYFVNVYYCSPYLVYICVKRKKTEIKIFK